MAGDLKIGDSGTCQAKSEMGLHEVGYGWFHFEVKANSEAGEPWVFVRRGRNRFDCNTQFFRYHFLFELERKAT